MDIFFDLKLECKIIKLNDTNINNTNKKAEFKTDDDFNLHDITVFDLLSSNINYNEGKKRVIKTVFEIKFHRNKLAILI